MFPGLDIRMNLVHAGLAIPGDMLGGVRTTAASSGVASTQQSQSTPVQ